MMTRGEVALIVAQKGLAIGVVDPVYFTAVILLIVVSSVATPLHSRPCSPSAARAASQSGKLNQEFDFHIWGSERPAGVSEPFFHL